jgi:hypothetical protein
MAVPVVAAAWHLVETAPAADAIAFAPPRRPDADKMEALLMALRADAAYDLPLNYQTGVGGAFSLSVFKYSYDAHSHSISHVCKSSAFGRADPYFAGKMMARMARLALIADELNQTAIVGALVARVKPDLQTWLLHTSANPLVYDASWGGLVSGGCNYDDCGGKCKPHCDNGGPPSDCPSLVTPGQDFGNAFYNDHHFHYGYWAVLSSPRLQ